MLWLFQVFALTAGLYGCQIYATSSLTYNSSKTTSAHVLHLGFLKQILSVKNNTDTHSLLRETGQMLIFFYWFRCTIRLWNNLLSSNNPLLEKVVQADLLLANRSNTPHGVDLSDSGCASRCPWFLTSSGCCTFLSAYQCETVWAHSAWTLFL